MRKIQLLFFLKINFYSLDLMDIVGKVSFRSIIANSFTKFYLPLAHLGLSVYFVKRLSWPNIEGQQPISGRDRFVKHLIPLSGLFLLNKINLDIAGKFFSEATIQRKEVFRFVGSNIFNFFAHLLLFSELQQGYVAINKIDAKVLSDLELVIRGIEDDKKKQAAVKIINKNMTTVVIVWIVLNNIFKEKLLMQNASFFFETYETYSKFCNLLQISIASPGLWLLFSGFFLEIGDKNKISKLKEVCSVDTLKELQDKEFIRNYSLKAYPLILLQEKFFFYLEPSAPI